MQFFFFQDLFLAGRIDGATSLCEKLVLIKI